MQYIKTLIGLCCIPVFAFGACAQAETSPPIPPETPPETSKSLYTGPAAYRINEMISENDASCREDGGVQTVSYDDIVSDKDINDDGMPDPYFGFYATQCSVSSSYWSGSMGSQWSVFMSQEDGAYARHDFTARAMKVVEFGGPVILLNVHTSFCVGRPCVRALTWDKNQDRFISSTDGIMDRIMNED